MPRALALVRYLLARGATVAVADSRAEPPELGTLRSAFPKVSVHLGPFEALSFSRDQTVVVSPGLAPESLPLDAIKAAGCPVRGELDLFFEEAKAPVLGITGTNGKSTVTVLLGHLLAAAGYRVAVGGNLRACGDKLARRASAGGICAGAISFQLDWSSSCPYGRRSISIFPRIIWIAMTISRPMVRRRGGYTPGRSAVSLQRRG